MAEGCDKGTTGYLRAFLALVLFGLYQPAIGKPIGWAIFAAACLFVVDCVFRIIDMRACASFPVGTHFAWRLGNGLMLGILLQAAARRGEGCDVPAQFAVHAGRLDEPERFRRPASRRAPFACRETPAPFGPSHQNALH